MISNQPANFKVSDIAGSKDEHSDDHFQKHRVHGIKKKHICCQNQRGGQTPRLASAANTGHEGMFMTDSSPAWRCDLARKAKSRANLPGFRGDKVYTPSPKAFRRAARLTCGVLSEPRREQNLYANPKPDSEALILNRPQIKTGVPVKTFKDDWPRETTRSCHGAVPQGTTPIH